MFVIIISSWYYESIVMSTDAPCMELSFCLILSVNAEDP